jgi:class 3 adenylate cyclase/predicted alpha/beta hydrolase family esterase
MEPDTRFLRYDGLQIAYVTGGDTGPRLLCVPDWFTNIDEMFPDLTASPLSRRIGTFCQKTNFDFPGTGSSDPIPLDAVPGLDFWVDIVRAVMDEIAWEDAVLYARDIGGLVALAFAARHPQRVSALILSNSTAALFPDAIPEVRDQMAETFAAVYGSPEYVRQMNPAIADDPYLVRQWIRRQRQAARPATVRAIIRMVLDVDVRDLLGDVRCPTLVVQSAHDLYSSPERARELVDRIPSATYVQFPGPGHSPHTPEETERWVTEFRRFLGGEAEPVRLDRVLTTILFTDIVSSTSRTAKEGDQRWRDLLDRHDEIVGDVLRHFGGRLIKNTGDGILATIDGPARAVRCAQSLREQVRKIGLELRAGLHTGEVEIRGDDIGGIAVTIARRVCDGAEAGEVRVSETLAGAVAGSGLGFDELGPHELKGVPGSWRLFRARD